MKQNKDGADEIEVDLRQLGHEYKRMVKGEIDWHPRYLEELLFIKQLEAPNAVVKAEIEIDFPRCDECNDYLSYIECDCDDGCDECFNDGGWLECKSCGGAEVVK